MGQTERIQDNNYIASRAATRYGSAGVPEDWFLDPADPQGAESYRQRNASSLEEEATAFLAAHELQDGNPEPEEPRVAAVRPGLEVGTVPPRGLLTILPGSEVGDESELSWQADSLCAQTDPEAFFPEKGGSTRDAKKVCGACTVRQQCLEYALANDERFGIWGGLSERERRRLRKRAV